ncbi:MAG TPA: hypothetical protein VHF69_11970 [Candidatus Synoicihabitans sp.]|nr:hypothetical protein [Candidatus Synoicihabitans sp.]
MKFRPSQFVFLGLALATALLSGCATASKTDAMVATQQDFGRQHATSVSVNVTGGRETSAAGASQISSADFRAAIVHSIEDSQLFSAVQPVGDAPYHLEVFITRLDQPVLGFSMTVTLETNWTLTRPSDGRVLWEKAIPTTYTARAGEALVGTTRLRLANEGAARTNIEAALKELSALQL